MTKEERLVEGSYPYQGTESCLKSTSSKKLYHKMSFNFQFQCREIPEFLHIAMMCERRVNIGSCCVAHVSSRREAAERLADQRRLMCVHPRGHRISDYGHTEL